MVTIVIVALCVVIALAHLVAKHSDNTENRWTGLIVRNISAFVAVLMIVGVGFYSTFRTIPAGNVGVTTLFGSVRPDPLHEGFNITLPLVEVNEMNVQIQKHEAQYLAASKDMQTVHVDMVLNFRLRPEQAPRIFQSIGSNYSKVIIDPAAQEVVKAELALHNAIDILALRPKVKDDIQRKLSVWLEKYGIELCEASLANVKFDPAYEKAIETKQVKEQEAEQKKYELIQAQRQAEIVVAKARGDADAAYAKAEGDARSVKVKGVAEAEYNLKVSQSITPEIIKMRYLEKWDGVLPKFSGNSNGMIVSVDPERK